MTLVPPAQVPTECIVYGRLVREGSRHVRREPNDTQSLLVAGRVPVVADLSPHDQMDDFLIHDSFQDAEFSHPQFELGHGVGPKPLDRPCRLVAEAGEDSGLDSPLLTARQCLQLSLGLVGDPALRPYS